MPRDLSAFEFEAFFNFSDAEWRVIEDRYSPALKLALALQIGFLRITGHLLEAVRIVPPALWRHHGQQLGVAAPDLASLRSMYQRRRTLFEHQEVACETLGFNLRSEAQRRGMVRVLRAELTRTSDRLARTIVEGIDALLAEWRAAATKPCESGATAQTWLWAAPAGIPRNRSRKYLSGSSF